MGRSCTYLENFNTPSAGTKSGKPAPKCDGCDGRGIKIVTKQMGSMLQQYQVYCPTCKGTGEAVKADDKCAGCQGAKIKKVDKQLEVFIEKGMQHGQRITFRGESDQAVCVHE